MELARELGMTRTRMLNEMTSTELTDWMALYQIEGREAELRALEARANQALARHRAGK